MSDYIFELNSQQFTSLGGLRNSFVAFSGNGPHRNNASSTGVANGGPIPLGRYFIVDRQSGGRLGWLRDAIRNADQWFALYRDDGTLDDTTFINSVRRGEFRLHPLGPSGMSTGCIVIQDPSRFGVLRSELLSSTPTTLPSSSLRAYGTITVVPPGTVLPPRIDNRGSENNRMA